MTSTCDVRQLKTSDKCPKCAYEKGKSAIGYSRMEEVDESETALVVFDEYEVKGVLDFRDPTAI